MLFFKYKKSDEEEYDAEDDVMGDVAKYKTVKNWDEKSNFIQLI